MSGIPRERAASSGRRTKSSVSGQHNALSRTRARENEEGRDSTGQITARFTILCGAHDWDVSGKVSKMPIGLYMSSLHFECALSQLILLAELYLKKLINSVKVNSRQIKMRGVDKRATNSLCLFENNF